MKRSSLVLAVPFALGTVVLVVVPAALTIALAFTNYDALRPPSWAGLGNLRRMVSDPFFRTAIWNSLIFVALAVPVRLLVAAGAALLFAPKRAGAGAGRAIAYLPTVVPDVSYALLWLWVFNPLFGPFALVARALGFAPPALLLNPWGARVAIVAMTAFQVGEAFFVALVMRRDIPQELYDLAALDGARPWWTFRRVTLPLMAPVLILLVARDVAVSFQVNFVPALVLTKGGPFYATTFLPYYTYLNAFEFFRFGYASAMTLVTFVLTVAMVGTQVALLRRWRPVHA